MKRRWRIVLALLLILAGGPLALFVVNGAILSSGETPISGVTSHAPAAVLASGSRIKVLSYNIAKGRAPRGGIRFREAHVVEKRIRAMAALIRRQAPDLVFLSEAIFECTPCPVNQVRVLAEESGMYAWLFGENYNFGLPFYRVVGGHAILSRRPLEAVSNPSLPGRRPFYVTRNNRRVLWGAMSVAGRRLLLAAVHNDSFDADNNLRQMRSILDSCTRQAAILAGDFNAAPGEPPLRLLRETGRFAGEFAGPRTFPARKPRETIDFIVAPAAWTLVDHEVIESDLSDHFPVVSTFQINTP